MEDYDVRSAASILASVKEQEARFEQLTRALEEERRNVTLQLERANLPPNNPPTSQPLAWQQVVMQVTPCQHVLHASPTMPPRQPPAFTLLPPPKKSGDITPLPFAHSAHRVSFPAYSHHFLSPWPLKNRLLIYPLDFWDTHPLCLLPSLASMP